MTIEFSHKGFVMGAYPLPQADGSILLVEWFYPAGGRKSYEFRRRHRQLRRSFNQEAREGMQELKWQLQSQWN